MTNLHLTLGGVDSPLWFHQPYFQGLWIGLINQQQCATRGRKDYHIPTMSQYVTMFPRYIPNGIPIIFQLYISIKMPIIWGPHEQRIPGPARAPSWAERGNPGPGSRKTLKNDGFTWSCHEKIGILSQWIPMDPMSWCISQVLEEN